MIDKYTKREDVLARDFSGIAPTNSNLVQLEWIRTEFHLPPSMLAMCSACFLRVWEGSYIASHIMNGLLSMCGSMWIVHWQSTPAVVKNATKVGCSFRSYQGKQYVVIKVWKPEQQQEQTQTQDQGAAE